MAASARRAEAIATDELMTAFYNALISLRNCSTEVARLRRNAIAAGLRELGRVHELDIAGMLDQMRQVEHDLDRIRRKLPSP